MTNEPRLPTPYERMSDPLAAIERVGGWLANSGMFGCDKKEQGYLIALACMVENKSPLDIARRYHIVEGRLSMRAEAMLAELRVRGGDYEWLKDGSEGVAELRITFGGHSRDIKFDMDEAKAMRVVKKDSGWEKNPAAMLRARVTSKAVRMMAPEINSGVYVPEEIEDIEDMQRPKQLFARMGEAAAQLPEPAPEVDLSSQRADVAALFKGREIEGLAFLRKAGWIKADQDFSVLTGEQINTILTRQERVLAKLGKTNGNTDKANDTTLETPNA